MKKYILSCLVMLFFVLACPVFSFAADVVNGVVQEQGLVKQQDRVSQPADTSSTGQATSKEDAQQLGEETAKGFYGGQVNLDEANRRYQEMLSQGRQREYTRGYSTWRSQHVPYLQQEEENRKASREPAAEENKTGVGTQ